MPQTSWQVVLHEARTQDDFLKSKVAADKVDSFAVIANNSQVARKRAETWLRDRGHTIRAINVSATEDKTLIAYVSNGSVAKSKAFVAEQAKKQLAARKR